MRQVIRSHREMSIKTLESRASHHEEIFTNVIYESPPCSLRMLVADITELHPGYLC